MSPVSLLTLVMAAETAGAPPAKADEALPQTTWSRVTLAGELGYAYPLGDTEQGGATRDVSFGLVPLSLSGSYSVTSAWAPLVRLRYAPNIPTLCASASDCASSLGYDVAISVGVARALPGRRRLQPTVELWASWEWLTSKLSDSGFSSSRSWNGPSAGLAVFVDLATGPLWSYGPVVGVEVGAFTHFDLDTPGGQRSGGTASEAHAWPTLAFRVGRRLTSNATAVGVPPRW